MSNVGTISAGFDFDFSQLLKGISQVSRRFGQFETQAGKSIKAVGRRMDSLLDSFFSFKTALAGAGFGLIAKGFLDTAASVEKLKVSLDTITKGHGQETFDALNQWAIDMPINTQKAIETFINLKAMGLDPTLETMTTLVDTTSALGGSEETLSGIARALGQIATKGKVSAEELMQLAEQGIPAYEILAQKFHLTGKQLGNIGNAGLDANKAITALVEGMNERFGGQASRMMSSWSGLMESLKAQVSEFERQVMESGPFQIMKDGLKQFLDYFNTAQGKLDLAHWAHNLSVGILKAFDVLLAGIQTFDAAIKPILTKMWDEVTRLWEVFKGLPSWVQEAGILGAAIGGKKGIFILGSFVHLLDTAKNSVEGFAAAINGDISFSDLATSNKEELEALLEGVKKTKEAINDQPFIFRGTVQQTEDSIDRLRAKLQEMINAPFQYKPMGKLELPQTGTKKPQTATGDDEATKAFENAQKAAQRKLMQATLSDLEFKKWAINQEIADFKKGVADKVSTEAEYLEFRKAKLKEIEQLELEATGSITDGWNKGWETATKKLQDNFATGESMAQNAASNMEGSFKTLFSDGMKGQLDDLGDYITSFFDSVLNAFIDLQAEMLAKSVMKGGSSLFGSLFSAFLPNAHGNAFVDGKVKAFATGGIVNRPTLFPMKTGMGLMGEAGAEAIMPLTRASNGDLGVKAVGTSSEQKMDIRIINESGQQMEVTNAKTTIDYAKQIVEVWIDAHHNNKYGLRSYMGG